jgi:CubicO group peptidase (beta-lactamase class C family)
MKIVHTVLAAALLLAFPPASFALDAAASTTPASPEQQVDALFAKWTKPDVPGCAVEVIRDGKVVLRKGYGMADIERGVPITSQTVFDVASMSKQFTAFAIHLLAQDGKLSLDDDFRKHLPDMPDFGHKITIRNLLQHTSGLRDTGNLAGMAGWRTDDVLTQDDALGLIRNQSALNFAPGDEHLYSNSGYILLAAIVERVSGKPLNVFTQERMFAPLGMTHTHFQTDYRDLVRGRALSYQPAGSGGYQYIAASKSTPGPGELLTTVEDLALWDQNFYDGRVGGKDLLAQMQVAGVLNNGKPITYASGLFVEEYRGARLVEHSGGVAGYATQMSRFPAQHFTVVVLANTPDVSPVAMTRRIADIYLDGQLAPKPVAATQFPEEIKLDEEKLERLAGFYALSPAFGINFTVENGRLFGQATGQGKFPMFATGEREFYAKVANAQFSFDAPDHKGVVPRMVLHQNGMDQPGQRGARPSMAEADLRQFEGEYYSDELRVLYKVARKDGKLVIIHPRGSVALEHAGGTNFTVGSPVGVVSFQCAAQAGCTGFRATTGRVRNLEFSKVAIVAPGARATAATGIFLKADPAVAQGGAGGKPAL